MRQPGVEPGSAAWKATMITATPLTLLIGDDPFRCVYIFNRRKLFILINSFNVLQHIWWGEKFIF